MGSGRERGTNPVDDVGMYGGRQLSTLSGITVHHVAAPPDIDRDREGDPRERKVSANRERTPPSAQTWLAPAARAPPGPSPERVREPPTHSGTSTT